MGEVFAEDCEAARPGGLLAVPQCTAADRLQFAGREERTLALNDSEELSNAFDEVASTYEVMVGLNPGYHRELLAAASALVATLPPVAVVLDLGCGSGASTAALLRAAGRRGVSLQVIGVDASAEMLQQARMKRWPDGVRFVHAGVEDLPRLDLPAQVDGVFACYLLRNVADRDAVLGLIRDQLARGGWLVAQDYSVRGDARATRRWRAVNQVVILPLAALVAHRLRLYRYLHQSVLDNDSMPELCVRLERAGFERIASRTARGWQRGILHTLRARRPVTP